MKEITVSELKLMMDQKEEFQLIDVREEYEHEEANIGGELIPLGMILQETDKIRKDIPVVIHCSSGSRSATVVKALELQHGFDNLASLKGGIVAWSTEIDPGMQIS